MARPGLGRGGALHAVFDWVDGLLMTDWVAVILRKTAENPARASCRALHNSSAGGKTHATFITYRPVRGEKLLHNLQFINKLIELCSKGRFDMFTEEETDPIDHRSAVRPEGNRHCAKSVHKTN